MKVVTRVLFGIVALAVVAAASGSIWFYIYSADIPGIGSIGSFAPSETTTLYDECSSNSIYAIPFKAIGNNVVNAVRTAEGGERTLAFQISRSLFCNHHGKMLRRHLREYKASVQLRRRFTEPQLLTIYLNRAYFGNGLVGIENASQHFYQKHPADLNVSEAAMMAGLIKGPQVYSPSLHPDRAKTRRDAIIAAMLKHGAITESDAAAAVTRPVVSKK